MKKFKSDVYKHINIGTNAEENIHKEMNFESKSLGDLINELMENAKKKGWEFDEINISFDRNMRDYTKSLDIFNFFIRED